MKNSKSNSKENRGPDIAKDPGKYFLNRKLLYLCLGTVAFVAACFPTNIVAWIYSLKDNGFNDVKDASTIVDNTNVTIQGKKQLENTLDYVLSNQTEPVRHTLKKFKQIK